MDVYITYSDEKQISNLNRENNVVFNLIDSNTKKGKKEAYSLKSYWGAKLDPFVIVLDEEKLLKAFYSETGEDVINNLNNYLKDANI